MPDTSGTFDISPDVLESRLRRCVDGMGVWSSGAVRLRQRGVWCVVWVMGSGQCSLPPRSGSLLTVVLGVASGEHVDPWNEFLFGAK